MEAETFTKSQTENDAVNITDKEMDDNTVIQMKEGIPEELENGDETQVRIEEKPLQGNDSHEVSETMNAQTSQSAEDLQEAMQPQENENRENPNNEMEVDATHGNVEENIEEKHLDEQEICTNKFNIQKENESKNLMEDADDSTKTDE